MLVCINIPLSTGSYCSHVTDLFIAWSYTAKLCLYQSLFLTLFIPVTLFVYTSHQFLLFIPVINFALFIKYTSAPVEVSVWLGGTMLKSAYDAFCDLVAVLVVWGLWEPHARARGRLVAGRLILAGRLPRLCGHQDVTGVAEGGKQSLSWSGNLNCSLLKFWEEREALFPSCSLLSSRSKCVAERLGRPVYIGLGVGLEIHQRLVQFRMANSHWSVGYPQIREGSTPRAA